MDYGTTDYGISLKAEVRIADLKFDISKEGKMGLWTMGLWTMGLWDYGTMGLRTMGRWDIPEKG